MSDEMDTIIETHNLLTKIDKVIASRDEDTFAYIKFKQSPSQISETVYLYSYGRSGSGVDKLAG